MVDEIVGRAFLVGSPYGGLKGTERDVESMAEMLSRRGFEVDRCCGANATRDGILAGYKRLVAQIGENEAAVFYYSGHGFWGFDKEQSGSWQGITPVDMDASSETSAFGITAWELSANQARLTARTTNVTVILDCCHASLMSRDAASHHAVPKAVPHPIRAGFKAHILGLEAEYGVAGGAFGSTGNQYAVRLAACGQDQAAYAYRAADGTYRSIFTEKVLEVLAEVGGASVSWAAIEEAIRGRVRARFPTQRPVIEGPALRRLFSTTTDEAGGALTILATPTGFELSGGRLQRVEPGDVYYVMPPGPPTYRPADAIAALRVRDSSATTANAELQTWRNCHKAVPRHAIAVPAKKIRDGYPVEINVPASAYEVVKTEIAATPTLRLLELGDKAPLATLRLSDGQLTIEDRLGALYPPREFPDGLPDTVKNLANLAAAEELRAQTGEHGVRADELEIEWGTVVRGKMQRMAEHGAALGLDDRLYVKIRSKVERKLYAHVFNIGLRSKITSMTNFAPSGVILTKKPPEFVLGEQADRTLVGVRLAWPKGLPRETFPRTDELVVIVTSNPANLHGYETREHLGHERGEGSKLARDGESSDGYFVKRLTYLLHPRDTAMMDIPFEIDRNPLGMVAAQSSNAWNDPLKAPPGTSSTISISIRQLVVQDREKFSGNLRIDGLICTRSMDGSDGYATWTHRCQGSENHRVPLIENQIVFRGPVLDFVQICLWVSRDTTNSSDLAAQLLEQRATSTEVADAASMLLTSNDARGVPWIAATGAGAILARIAHRLLDHEGAATGIFRGAFLTRNLAIGGSPIEEVHHSENIVLSLVTSSYGEVP